jgi:sugar phosphate isomerase/epimerase
MVGIQRSRLSACAFMTPNWPLDKCIAGWHRAGLAGIGLPLALVEEAGVTKAVSTLRHSGLAVANLQNLDPFDIVAPERFEELLPRTCKRLDLAAELQADCIFAITGPRGSLDWDEASRRLVGQIEILIPELEERDVRLALEPIHPLRQDLSFINTATDIVAVLKTIGNPHVGYAFDFWHLWWERHAIELVQSWSNLIFSVQPSDHKAMTLRTLDRAVPGRGVAPVAELVVALETGGYSGFYDLEVLSDDNEAIGYDRTLSDAVSGFGMVAGGILD